MKIIMKPTKYEKFGIYADRKRILVCNRAFNAHLIATILQDDENEDVTKKVIFKE